MTIYKCFLKNDNATVIPVLTARAMAGLVRVSPRDMKPCFMSIVSTEKTSGGGIRPNVEQMVPKVCQSNAYGGTGAVEYSHQQQLGQKSRYHMQLHGFSEFQQGSSKAFGCVLTFEVNDLAVQAIVTDNVHEFAPLLQVFWVVTTG